jgi:hypothetical protein
VGQSSGVSRDGLIADEGADPEHADGGRAMGADLEHANGGCAMGARGGGFWWSEVTWLGAKELILIGDFAVPCT